MSLVKLVYELTSTMPKEEKYGLIQQMRRAAVSVPSNIAEGSARTGVKESLQFYLIARSFAQRARYSNRTLRIIKFP